MQQQMEKHIETTIVEAAIVLFSTKGFETTLDDIVEASGISKAEALQYFQSKEEIIQFIIKQQIQFIRERLQMLTKWKGSLTPSIIQLFVDLSNNIQHSQVSLQMLLQFSLMNPVFRQTEYSIEQIVEVLEELFEKGQRSGEFNTLLSSNTMAQLACQQYFGILMTWCMNRENYSLQERVKISFGMLFNGLLNRN